MALASRRTLGATSAGPTAQNKTDLVTIATLVRGRVYFYKDLKFEYGIPLVVSDEIAGILEQECAEVKDKDGERFEKPFFEVKRGVPRPDKYLTEAERNRKPIRRLPPASLRARA